MVGRLRLWSGYVLFAYVTTHLLNHALGLISLRVIEAGRIWFVFVWQSLPGQAVLYGALVLHFTLALWAIMRRRSLSSRPGNGRSSCSACRSSRWPRCTSSPRAWRTTLRRRERLSLGAGSLASSGWRGIARQFALPFVVWIHACIGLHFAWRLRSWYRDWLPALYAIALLVPAAASPARRSRCATCRDGPAAGFLPTSLPR